ncbi:1-deoxy-D-xylulose-5-phosphate synthase [Synergistaceae bacterium OttesenSCG-928-I11]|nr:1-deoxy-D-xylulose-5-phosphate synthase [Synergistaceae bacterium OttesenSCG-928-I11]
MKKEPGKTILESVKNFKGLAILGEAEIDELCCDIRTRIIDVTLKNGGHLGGSLGTVELCVALLRSFNPERDKIVFDVGHQTYAYKLLTDRLDRFHTLRTKGGISGFPRRAESCYDAFDVGHSSTSISVALGFAKARDLRGLGHEVVAVIGDGSLLNGLALEALNNVSACDTKLTIVLNDNKMSISPRVGGMAEHLARLAVSSPYKRFKQFLKDRCRNMLRGEWYENKLGNIKTKLKSLLQPTNIFEAMEISYWGPFDGHDVRELERIFEMSKQYSKPLLIHVITQKGRGCADAEAMPSVFHGVGSGTVIGHAAKSAPKALPVDWSQAVADNLIRLAEHDPRVVACTAAMADGTRLNGFKEKFPARFFDVGIAEGHMLTYAAGMAAGGMMPAVCIYSTFLQRAMDQMVHDICMQKHPVLIAVDRAGLNGEDGETHQGLLDVSWGRGIPGLTIGVPRDKVDLAFMMDGWHERAIPMTIRYPKGKAPEAVARDAFAAPATPAAWGRAEVLREGAAEKDVCLMGLGCMVGAVLEAADACPVSPTVVDLRFAAPLDWETIDDLLARHALVVVAEDGYRDGGVGEAIAARAASLGLDCRVLPVAAPAAYIPHASRGQQMEEYGLTASAIAALVEEQYRDYGGIGTAASG